MSLSEEVKTWVKGAMPLYEFIDLRVAPAEGDLFRAYVSLNKNSSNHIKTMHAAVQFAAAEILGGTTIIAHRANKYYAPIVKKLSIEYKKPATTDIVSEAVFTKADAEKMNSAMASQGRYDFDLDITVKNAEGEVVSIATGSFAVRDFKKTTK